MEYGSQHLHPSRLDAGSDLVGIPPIIGIAKRFPPWLMATVAVTGLVIAARPRMILYLGPVVAAIAVLQFVGWLFKPLPNPKSKQQRKTEPKSK